MNAPLNVCEQRDPKGLCQKARAGQIANFTGIDSDYEEPGSAEIIIDTSRLSLAEFVSKIVNYLKNNNFLKPSGQCVV